MAFRFDPQTSVRREVRRVVAERLGEAITTLESLQATDPAGPPPDVASSVHTVRKRCKEVRGLAQLVRPVLGRDFARFNGLVRDAAAELAGFRDAHAGLATFEHLLAGVPGARDDTDLQHIRDVLEAAADDATRAASTADPRLARAHAGLVEARDRASRWKVPKDFSALGSGLGDTYRRGRRRLQLAQAGSTDEVIHEWRKAVKQLWYEARLVEPAAPSVLSPFVARLDDLSEALGDDHDLAVLADRLAADPERFGGGRAVKHATALARYEQELLRGPALRLGATLFAERPSAFVERLGAYWNLAARSGPELTTGGIVALRAARADAAGEGPPMGGPDESSTSSPPSSPSSPSPDGDVERERKFLVADVPEHGSSGVELRQGYLAIDHPVSVRIRDAGDEGCTLTVKAGSGATRTELEWEIARDTFDVLWGHTGRRRIAKTRYRLPHDGHTIELDVFHDALDGLVVAEVEFADERALDAFAPPDWFGDEVTDDHRYTNAWLAEHGRCGPGGDGEGAEARGDPDHA